ncbi:MAG: hypothetical protein R3346_03180 [Candidatus Spechtbacterales bacterium]|nr:hypothetical protein [Candidatus Spechtbacterales bacterium]
MSDKEHAHRFEIEPAYYDDEEGIRFFRDVSVGVCTVSGCEEEREFENRTFSSVGDNTNHSWADVSDVHLALRRNPYAGIDYGSGVKT